MAGHRPAQLRPPDGEPVARFGKREAGCVLLWSGILLGGFGSVALAGLAPVELEFFGIEIDNQLERSLWVAGCLIAIVAGLYLLRITKPKRDVG